MRCRHTFDNARRSPCSSRSTTMGWPSICASDSHRDGRARWRAPRKAIPCERSRVARARGMRPTYRPAAAWRAHRRTGARSSPAIRGRSRFRHPATLRGQPYGLRFCIALRWTPIYQVKLPAKILFSDVKASFFLCSRARRLRGQFAQTLRCSSRMCVSQNSANRFTNWRGFSSRDCAMPSVVAVTSSLNCLITKSAPSTVLSDFNGKLRML